jgi:hypothetical protein
MIMKLKLKIAILTFLILLLGIFYLGCKADNSINSFDNLVNRLKSEGFKVEPSGEIFQDFFSVKGKIIKVNDEDIQVFEYDSKSKADEEIKLVSPDGSSIGTFMVSWISTPHFYRTNTMIILYIGDNDKITSFLNDVINPQFAGR